jgi:hypothetical protein
VFEILGDCVCRFCLPECLQACSVECRLQLVVADCLIYEPLDLNPYIDPKLQLYFIVKVLEASVSFSSYFGIFGVLLFWNLGVVP